jgi:integrase
MGALRKVKAMTSEEGAKEAVLKGDGTTAFMSVWVPGWISYKAQTLSASSRERYDYAWGHLSEFLSAKKIKHPAEVSYSICHEYVRWRTDRKSAADDNRKVGSWNSAVMEVRVLGAILQESLRRGWIIANPCARLGLKKQPAKEKNEVSREEESFVLSELKTRGHDWMHDAFLVAMRQGCRLAETEVPLSRIDETAMTITFWVKGGKYHVAPLHKDVLPVLRAARSAGRQKLVEFPHTPKDASSKFTRFFRRVGLRHICFHCTRVTVVTRLCRAGFSESQSMGYVGHASDVVHAIYRKLKPKDLAHLGDAL